MVFNILDNKVEFDDEIIFFVKRLFEFENTRDRVITDIDKIIKSNNILKALENTDVAFKKCIKEIIAELSIYEVYDKIEEDFIGGNPGYTALIDAFNEYIDRTKEISDKHNFNAENYLDKEARLAKSQITGLDFGIITNDFFSMWIYDSMNESKIRKETENAKKNYSEVVNRVTTLTKTNIEKETAEYRQKVLIPSVNKAITEFYLNLFAQYIALLSQNGKFKLSCIDSLDEKRAQALLENVKIVEKPEKLIVKSIGLCPYRIDAYLLAEDIGLFTNEMAQCCKTFFLSQEFEQKVIDAYLVKDGNDICISASYSNLKKHLSSIEEITGISERETFKNIVSCNIENIERSIINFISIFADDADRNKKYWLSFNTKGNTKGEIEQEILMELDKIINRADYLCLKENTGYDILEYLNEKIAPIKVLTYEELQSWVLSQAEEAITSYIDENSKSIQEKEYAHHKEREAHQLQKKRIKQVSILALVVTMVALIIKIFPILQEKHLNRQQYKEAVEKYGEFLGGFEVGQQKSTVDSLFVLLREDGDRSFYEVDILGINGELQVDYASFSNGEMRAEWYVWRSEENVSVDKEWFMNCCNQYYVVDQSLIKEELIGSSEIKYTDNGGSPYIYVTYEEEKICITYLYD